MRDRDDFTAYVQGRWPALLGTLLHLGVPAVQAREALTAGLAHCRRDWADLRQGADLDLVVLRAAARRLHPVPPDRLLRSGLAEHSWADRAGIDPTPDLAGIAAAQRAERCRRRRQVTVSLTVLAALLTAAVAVSWALTRPRPPPELVPVVVEQRANPLDTVWHAEGVLHLPAVTLALPGLEQAVAVREGAAYGDSAGRVVLVRGDGSREVIGHQTRGAPLASSTRRGLVAWVEPGPAGATLRVYDALTHRYVPGLPVALATEPVAVAGDRVLYRAPDAAYAWRPPDGGPERLAGGLAEAYSDSGRFALSYLDSGAPNSLRGRLVVTDLVTGLRVDAGIGAAEVIVKAMLTPDDALLYVAGIRDQLPRAGEYLRLSFSGPLAVRRCSLAAAAQGTPRCEQLARLPRNTNVPTLPVG